ncbi:hypothetical protein ACFL4N_04065 [Thermodesulfobacteriota bacterium]
MSKYNTNLASEFHVLSTLHRLGLEAVLTLGNKKMVDIVITDEKGEVITIDVKGLAGKYDWPADNIKKPGNSQHYIALVSFEGRIDDPSFTPKVWIIPYGDIKNFEKQYATRKNISRSLIVNKGKKYLHAWELLTNLSED